MKWIMKGWPLLGMKASTRDCGRRWQGGQRIRAKQAKGPGAPRARRTPSPCTEAPGRRREHWAGSDRESAPEVLRDRGKAGLGPEGMSPGPFGQGRSGGHG